MLAKFVKQLMNQPDKKKENPNNSGNGNPLTPKQIQDNLQDNIQTFKKLYSYPKNSDITFRNLKISGLQKQATLLFIKTITDIQEIENSIISPLISNQDESKIENIVAGNTITTTSTISSLIKHVNGGDAILFIEGFQVAYIFNAGNFESRNIEQPENEHVVKGPKEAFIEKASSNISLIRKKIKNENLIVESMSISKRANNEVFMLYVNDLANDKLVDNIKKRLDSLDVDMIQNLSLLEQYIDERSYSVFPTILYTERPDRAASFIADGFIVLIMDNSPDCLILPATFWSFYHNAEDYYLRLPYGNFTRFLRGLALLITLLTSAIYIALTTFHAGMIPPDLLFAIVSARFKVPLTVFAEIILMEIAFELIREAGLRVPTPIGPTIGIVGALILGQAAVQANVVSPVVVIVVALGGLCSFVIGDYSLNYAFRISRFACICAAYLFGFYGIMAVFVMGLTYLSSLKSFGVPYLSPLTPSYIPSKNTIFRTILSKDRFRPGFIKPKDTQKKTGD